MCRYRSGEVVKIDGGVKVYALPGEDSHTKIREKYCITDDYSGLGHCHCPIEFVPRGELDEYDKYELIYNDRRPEWITDAIEADICRQMRRIVKADDFANWAGNLDLADCTGLTSLPDGMTAGGYINLAGCTGLT